MDKLFRVEVISQTPNPQQVIYAAMHQDYAEGFVFDEQEEWPSEDKAGAIIVGRLLKGGRGHFGPLEHPQIVLNVGWFPHSTMQQIRTHRVGVSFDTQSFRYTGQRIVDLANQCDNLTWEGKLFDFVDRVDKVFYLRLSGMYSDRNGKKYEYTRDQRNQDAAFCVVAAQRYRDRINEGFAEEHARGLIPFDVRQHWVMSCNVRSLLHIFELRTKADAQLECQQLCELMWPHFEAWVPAIAAWYKETRYGKARLAP